VSIFVDNNTRLLVQGITGKEGQKFLFYPDGSMSLKAKRVLVVGLGKEELSREIFRKAGGIASRQALESKAGKLLVVVPVELAFQAADIAECLAEGLVLGSYQFLKYKKEDEDEKPGKIAKISFYSPKHTTAVRRGKLKKNKSFLCAFCAL